MGRDVRVNDVGEEESVSTGKVAVGKEAGFKA